MEWPQEFHHRFKSVYRNVVVYTCRAITTKAKDTFQPAAVGANDIIEKVPGFYTQRLARVKSLVRVWRFVIGDIQQALIHNGDGIGHFFA